MKTALKLAAIFCFAGSSLAQNYYTLLPGQEAIVSFHFNGSTLANGNVPDLLAVEIGCGVPFGSHISGTAYSLLDGTTLLGTVTRSEPYSLAGQAFRSLENPLPGFTPAPSVPVDFSSIRDGSIQGRFVYEPLFTDPTADDWVEAEFEFYLLKQYDNNGGSRMPDPIIDSVQVIAVPEPSAAALMAVTLVFTVRRPRRWPAWSSKSLPARAGNPCPPSSRR